MTKHFYAAVLTALIATILSVSTEAASAKQQCTASADGHGYWSWRLIDGRKCWYQGKPMLSKSELEWPAQSSQWLRQARSSSDEELASALPEKPSALPGVVPEKPGNPLDAQARAIDPETFDALWNARIGR
jgi:hypothetical protein